MFHVLMGGMRGMVKLLIGACLGKRKSFNLVHCCLRSRKHILFAIPLFCLLLLISVKSSLSVPLTVNDANLFGKIWPPDHGKLHAGVDFNVGSTTAGKSVFFNEAGVVKKTHLDSTGWGYCVVIEPTSRPNTTYVVWHIGLPLVTAGQVVEAGTQLGNVYDLGSNSHVHLGFRNAPYHSTNSMKGALLTVDFPEFFENPPDWNVISLDAPASSIVFTVTSYSKLLESGGQLNITVPGSNIGPGEVVLYNGYNGQYSPPAVYYKADIAVASNNWVNNADSTSININLFSPSSLGNLGITSGSPAIDAKFVSPVKIQVFGKIDPVSSIAPLLGEGYFPFKDVDPKQWASCYIVKLWRHGIINGQNGLYKPSDKVTRAEFLKMAMNAKYGSSQFQYSPVVAPYFDVSSQWYAGYVEVAKNNGFLAALTDSCSEFGVNAAWGQNKCFRPDFPITRFEAVSIITKAFGLSAVSSSRVVFKDALLFNTLYSTYLYPAANSKGNSGCGNGDEYIVSGYSDGRFGVNDPIQRDQAAKIIALAMGVKKEQ